MAPIPRVSVARSISARMRSLSLALKVRRRGRSDNSADAEAGAGLGIDLCLEHGHERDDPSAPSGLNSRGDDVSPSLARRGFTSGSGRARGCDAPRHSPIYEPTTALAKPVPQSAGIWLSTIASDRIGALLLERRIASTSTTCRCSRQHEFRRRCRGITPVGLRPPCVTPRQRQYYTINRQRAPLIEGETLSRRSQPPL
jgi:hypothetical protein